MFVNSFNSNQYLPGNQFLPKSHLKNSHPNYNNLTDPSTFTSTSLPTDDNSQQFAFPEFQGKSLSHPIGLTFSSLGNSLLSSLPTWLTPRNAVIPTIPR